MIEMLNERNKTMKNITSIIFMILLAVTNIIVYSWQPCKLSAFDHVSGGHHLGGVFVFAMKLGLIVYLPAIVLGTISVVMVLYRSLTEGKEKKEVPFYCAIFTLSTLVLVTYGTFWKKSISEIQIERQQKEWENELLLKSYGRDYSKEIHNRGSIYWGDTLISKHGEYIDTLVIDAANKTCHWTYKPEVNYEIIFDHRDRFEESPRNESYCPQDYDGKIQYIINCVNNHKAGQFYCDGYSYHQKYENDSIICFAIDSYYSDQRKGFLLFKIQDSIVTLVDSSSNIYMYKDMKDYWQMESQGFIAKENGMPLLKFSYEKMSKALDRNYTMFYDYYDIEKKQFVLNTLYIESKCDSVTKKGSRIDIDIIDYNREDFNKYQNGYPIFHYQTEERTFDLYEEVNEDSPRTIETGEYRMENGEYRKIKTSK